MHLLKLGRHAYVELIREENVISFLVSFTIVITLLGKWVLNKLAVLQGSLDVSFLILNWWYIWLEHMESYHRTVWVERNNMCISFTARTFQKRFASVSVEKPLKISNLIWPFSHLIKLLQFSQFFPLHMYYFWVFWFSPSGIFKKNYVWWTYLNILEWGNSIFLLVQAYKWYVNVPKMTQYLLIHIKIYSIQHISISTKRSYNLKHHQNTKNQKCIVMT